MTHKELLELIILAAVSVERNIEFHVLNAEAPREPGKELQTEGHS